MLGFAVVVRGAQRGRSLPPKPVSSPDPTAQPVPRYQPAAAVPGGGKRRAGSPAAPTAQTPTEALGSGGEIGGLLRFNPAKRGQGAAESTGEGSQVRGSGGTPHSRN